MNFYESMVETYMRGSGAFHAACAADPVDLCFKARFQQPRGSRDKPAVRAAEYFAAFGEGAVGNEEFVPTKDGGVVLRELRLIGEKRKAIWKNTK